MTFDLFRTWRETPLDPGDWQGGTIAALAGRWASWQEKAQAYIPERHVAEAVNVAIALGKPLLVTGEPGVGKSQLADAVAWQLGLPEPFKFVAKSTSEARDLFYRYDALARFHAIEAARHLGAVLQRENRAPTDSEQRAFDRPGQALNFIEYAALGRAILCAHEKGDVLDLIAEPDGLQTDVAPERRRIFAHPMHPRRSVVLIDEIDKASADFCNDLLDEIDNLRFSVPEVSNDQTPRLDPSMRPIVLITSNQERELPPAFLRRCVYANIPYPGPAPDDAVDPRDYYIENILAQRVGRDPAWSVLMNSVIRAVSGTLQRPGQMTKPPGTAELIDLIEVFHAVASEGGTIDFMRPLAEQPEHVEKALRVLAKSPGDLERIRRLAEFRPAEPG